jgi:hypothetical protein
VNGDSPFPDDVGEVPLPPAVTRWRSPNARKASDGVAPPSRAAAPAEPESTSPLDIDTPLVDTTEETAAPSSAQSTADTEIEATDAPSSELAPAALLQPVEEPVSEPQRVTPPQQQAPILELNVEAPTQTVEDVKSPEVAPRIDLNLANLIAEVVGHQAHENADQLAHELADRLEKLTERLRTEDFDVVRQELAQGDRLDVLVAGFLGGYAAVRKD